MATTEQQETSKFIWVADEFKDDTFDSEGNNISAKVIADSIKDLIFKQILSQTVIKS